MSIFLTVLLLAPTAIDSADVNLMWRAAMLAGAVTIAFVTVKVTQKGDAKRLAKVENRLDAHELFHMKKAEEDAKKAIKEAQERGEMIAMLKVLYEKYKD